MDFFKLKQADSNDNLSYGEDVDSENKKIPVKLYQPDTGSMHPKNEKTAFLMNQPIQYGLKDHKVKVNFETGVLVQTNYSCANTLNFPTVTSVQPTNGLN